MALYIACCCCCCSFFFFKQKTAYEMRISDWSSDVCSSDLPTLVRLGMERGPDGCRAGGLFLQHLPEGEEGRERLHTRLDHPEWEHVVALAQTMGVDELADAGMPLETLVWRLFNRSEEHTSELQSLMRNSYAGLCLKKKKIHLTIIYERNSNINTMNILILVILYTTTPLRKLHLYTDIFNITIDVQIITKHYSEVTHYT